MLHNKRRKSKGENLFILLFLLQEMMHPRYPCPGAPIQERKTGDTDSAEAFSQPFCG